MSGEAGNWLPISRLPVPTILNSSSALPVIGPGQHGGRFGHPARGENGRYHKGWKPHRFHKRWRLFGVSGLQGLPEQCPLCPDDGGGESFEDVSGV